MGGEKDLRNKHVRVDGPEKIEILLQNRPREIIRIVRLVGYGRTIDEALEKAIKEKKDLIYQVQRNDLEEEIRKIYDELDKDIEKTVELLKRFDLHQVAVIKEILASIVRESMSVSESLAASSDNSAAPSVATGLKK